MRIQRGMIIVLFPLVVLSFLFVEAQAFTISSNPDLYNLDPRNPAIAYNSYSNEYLVVYVKNYESTNIVYGQRIDPRGNKIDNEFQVSCECSDRYKSNPSVVYNPRIFKDVRMPDGTKKTYNDEYLIAWELRDTKKNLTDQTKHDTYIEIHRFETDGRRISVAKSATNDGGIRVGKNDPRIEKNPRVTLLSNKTYYGEYAVVFETVDSKNNYDIQVATFTRMERNLRVQTIAGTKSDERNPDISANPASGNYLVTWQQRDVGTKYAIKTNVFDSSGVSTNTQFTVSNSSSSDNIHPRISAGRKCSNTTGCESYIIWENKLSDYVSNIKGRLVNATKPLGSPAFTRKTEERHTKPSVCFDPQKNRFIIG